MAEKAKQTRRGRGQGSVEELPSGKFRAVASIGIDTATKKRVKITKSFDTKGEALKWWRDRQREYEGGTLTATATTLGDWMTTWMEIRKANVAANTYRTESDTAERRVRPGLGHVRLRDLKPLVVERWFAAMAAADVTQNERHKAGKLLRTCLNDAVRRKVIGASPMAGVTIPQPPEAQTTAIDSEQLAALVAAAATKGPAVEALFRLWADTGLRPGELYALTWDDFDPAAGKVRVNKSLCQTTGAVKDTKTKGSRRVLLLAPSTVAALKVVAGPKGVMFQAPGGGHWWRKSFVTVVFDPVAKAAKLADVLTPYTLRHTMATLLLQAGVSLKVVSERLGHDDVTTTLKSYAHVLPGMQEAAASAMELILTKRPVAEGAGPVVPQQSHAPLIDGRINDSTADRVRG